MIASWDWKKKKTSIIQRKVQRRLRDSGRCPVYGPGLLWGPEFVACCSVRGAVGAGRGRGAKRLFGKKRDLRGKCLWRKMAHFCSAGKAQEEPGSWPSSSPTRPPSIGKCWLSRRGPWWSHLAALMLRGSDLQPWNWGALAKAAVTTQSAICQGCEG